MDMVVNRLSEIEAASVRIIDEANAQKKSWTMSFMMNYRNMMQK